MRILSTFHQRKELHFSSFFATGKIRLDKLHNYGMWDSVVAFCLLKDGPIIYPNTKKCKKIND